jgi:solute:Na+ symporter, SSS family
MHLDVIDWLIIAVYLLVSLFIGLYYRKQAGKSLTAFFLGGRNLGWFIAGTSMVATTFAADTPLAVTELVSEHGISGNWLWWNFLIGGMLTTFFFAKYWRRSGVLTEVELIELRYSGKPAAFLRGFKAIYLGLFMNCLIIGWVNLALASLIEVFFGISGSDALMFVAAAMVLTAVYSSLSGLLGVAITDMIQFFVAMAGCIILAVLVVNSEPVGGIDGMKASLPKWSLDFFPRIGNSVGETAGALTISLGAFLAYTSVQWWASWYPGSEPGGGGYIAQRMMSAKDEKNSLFATLYFQIAHYCVRPWPWIMVGLACIILYPDLPAESKRLGYVMAMKDFLPTGLKGLLLVAFLAAYMSTISTQLNWGSSYIVNDIFGRFIKNKNSSAVSQVHIARITTFVIMALGLFVTTLINSISGVWSFIIECGAGLGLVLILRWYWWRINAWSEITATAAPFIGYAFGRYYLGLEFPDSFFLTVGFTTACWLLVTFITKPEDTRTLARFFNKVNPAGFWQPVRDKSMSASEKKKFFYLFICWISAITMTYSILFFTGKIIFRFWDEALIFGVSAVISFIILRYAMVRSGIFDPDKPQRINN